MNVIFQQTKLEDNDRITLYYCIPSPESQWLFDHHFPAPGELNRKPFSNIT